MNFALIGNPNSGKTTLFNSLTGATAKTGNWPGVTVEKKEGKYKEHTIIDLPGIYSLSPYSPEERVSRDYIIKNNPECVINIVDVTNLERNLYLTLQLLEMDVPVILALNMIDIAKKKNIRINKKLLEEKLGVPVVEISALKQEGLEELINKTQETSANKREGFTVISNNIVKKMAKEIKEHGYYYAVKLVEDDEYIVAELPTFYKDSVENLREKTVEEYVEEFADQRYLYIGTELKNVVSYNEGQQETKTEKIDRILTHRIWGLPIFLLIMFLVFHLTFGEDFLFLGALGIVPESFNVPILGEGAIASPGIILFNLMDLAVGYIGDGLSSLLSGAPEWCSSLLVDGVWGGVGAILSFVPNIIALFFFITILEDCGYMARVAYLMDKIFKGVGLSGKAFIPLLSCFGCAVPGIMATKTLKGDKERRITIMLSPFFSCGAKLPIWTSFAVLLFGGAYADMIVFGVYIFGIVVAIITAAILNKILKGKSEPFIMEMPQYHLPQAKNVCVLLWQKCKHYVVKAGTLIAASIVVLWFLTNFSWTLDMVEMDQSILGSISNFIAPLFTPLGFVNNEYQAVFVVAIFAGLIAKEEVPAVFEAFGILELAVAAVTPAAIFAYMAFNLLVVPCMAAVSAAKGELGNRKHFWLTILFWVVTAYISALIVYGIASLIAVVWWVSIILGVVFVGVIAYLIVRSIRNERVCVQ